jgi:hypothetical protein
MELPKRGIGGDIRSVLGPRIQPKWKLEDMIVPASCMSSSAFKVGTLGVPTAASTSVVNKTDLAELNRTKRDHGEMLCILGGWGATP